MDAKELFREILRTPIERELCRLHSVQFVDEMKAALHKTGTGLTLDQYVEEQANAPGGLAQQHGFRWINADDIAWMLMQARGASNCPKHQREHERA